MYGNHVKFDNQAKAMLIDLSIVPRATIHDFVLAIMEILNGKAVAGAASK